MASDAIETTESTTSTIRAQRYRELAATLRQWLNEDDGYDERVWPVVAQALNKDGIKLRDLDATHS